ncbi:ABC transporter permease [Treponema vincentii]|uniref:ABC transporter permease n=1 Tax=Treponema vincentii TaxID=69710 RepID=UPI0020A578F6|nr:ABC transporter permease [Treponema vincentii]UTC60039.1 ABC transporter permease [Treponema vincentii]
MLEDFVNALNNFRVKKLRTILSLLGIAIGVTVVTIISNIGSSMQASMVKMFNLDTMNIIEIEPRWGFQTRKSNITFTEKYRTELEQAVPLIKNVFYTGFFNATLSRKTLTLENKRVNGIEHGWLEANNYELLYGQGFTLDDFANRRHKIILGEDEVNLLFPEGDAIGKTVTVTVSYRGTSGWNFIPFSFEVCGVVKSNDNFSNIEAYFIPRSFVVEDMGIGKNDSDLATVQIHDSNYIDEATEQIKAFSDSFAKASDTLWTFSYKELLTDISSQITLVSAILTAIAVMSLIVGGINIMNIMLVTVTERKKEIGIRKALGASEAVIRNQFLVEAATLSLTGGIFGMLLGGGISVLLVQTVFQSSNFEMVFSPNITGSVIAFAVSITIGIFFGFRPAVKAARLDPVKALSD